MILFKDYKILLIFKSKLMRISRVLSMDKYLPNSLKLSLALAKLLGKDLKWATLEVSHVEISADIFLL